MGIVLQQNWFEIYFQNFECSIQLVQASLLREGMKLLNPIYSTSSAPGMIVGTGVVGEDIGLKTFTEHDFENSNPKSNGDTSFMFLSVNGGISFSVVIIVFLWNQLHHKRKAYIVNFLSFSLVLKKSFANKTNRNANRVNTITLTMTTFSSIAHYCI